MDLQVLKLPYSVLAWLAILGRSIAHSGHQGVDDPLQVRLAGRGCRARSCSMRLYEHNKALEACASGRGGVKLALSLRLEAVRPWMPGTCMHLYPYLKLFCHRFLYETFYRRYGKCAQILHAIAARRTAQAPHCPAVDTCHHLCAELSALVPACCYCSLAEVWPHMLLLAAQAVRVEPQAGLMMSKGGPRVRGFCHTCRQR